MDGVENKVAVIAGGTDQIGQAISLALANGGAKVAVCDVNQKQVDSIVEKIKEKGQQAIGLAMDPSKPEKVKEAIDKIKAEFGVIDILVNNVDDSEGWEIADVLDDRWRKSVDKNLNAVFYFCREIIPGMRKNKYGRVVNITSIDYLGWCKGKVNISATKSAVFGLTRSLALEGAKDNVTTNCVIKGDIAESDLPKDKSEKMASRLPVKRLGKTEDIARTVGFFASQKSKYITGQMLFACGGKSLYSSLSV
ncbi:SDR family NAD(P)-dependent oxidoreductase [Desulfosarcina ovata]|uniref:3-oxoacyl-[acyl-carrier-protein] reductase FabG n=1 Tax=Desulfosarcina ovata subsp. ovata TaxID=2752305 RepID=A0A5K8A6N9_9BACT|nr:SDR family oxidoreductase [Desulfosarcina ovata]BBO88116.1 3-oxoacyl-[acyl-carrier-protein] reductase FabG [Desulfosarcina ovata subsp. ovata]